MTEILVKQEIIDYGTQVIQQELEGLVSLRDSLGESFAAAVNIILSTRGKLVISGIGKSGHIGKKIAASFSSTGTPAVFVHPSEASHGDMGIIGCEDTLILLSNSGETRELHDILYYAKRNEINLIAIVREEDSTLAKMSNLALVIPAIPEVNREIAAPTTSAIMMLAIGDALTIATMRSKGFTKESYKLLHPGGKLGASLLKVEDLMHSNIELPLITRDAGLQDIVEIISAKGFGCVGIVDEKGILIGIITDGDLRRQISKGLEGKKAGDIMSVNPKTILAQDLALQAMKYMQTYKITNLFVVENQKPIGLLHIHDCLRAGL